MDIERLRQKLVSVARAHPPGDHVPYAFEGRVMNRLRGLSVVDPWTAWGGMLWRASTPYLAILLAISIWSLFGWGVRTEALTLATELDRTVLAPLASFEETW